jgi:putative transposase
MIEIARDRSRSVKRWHNGQMALRWCAVGMIQARAEFRRVNGHLHLRALRAALDRHVGVENVGRLGHNETIIAA